MSIVNPITIVFTTRLTIMMRQEGISKQQYNVLITAFIFGLASVGIGLMAILFSYKQVVDMNAEYRQLNASVTVLKAESKKLQADKLVPVSDTMKETATTPAGVVNETTEIKPAVTPTEEQQLPVVKEPVQKKKLKAPAAKVSPRDVVLTYYHRSADNASLMVALQALGYRFEEKTFDKNTGYEKTNCIWYGAGVPAAEVKKVAIAIIQSGNPIKGIKRFGPSYKNPSYKRNIIEVGREQNYEKYYTRPMSIYEVQIAKL